MLGGIRRHWPLIFQQRAHDLIGQRRPKARTAGVSIDLAARDQQRIANHFTIEPSAWEVTEKSIVGIGR